MAKTLELASAEREANEIGKKFANSSNVMADMSKAYNVDFSNINIHTDAAADAKVKNAGRDAVASGRDIYFGAGIYESKDPASKGLVAHELAHTMQQGVAGDGKSDGVSEQVPQGAEQGGFLDVFKKMFGRKKPKIEFLGAEKDTSDEAKQYMYLNSIKSSQMHMKNMKKARQNTAGIVGRRVFANKASDDLKMNSVAARAEGVITSNKSWNSVEQHRQMSAAYQGLGFRSGEIGGKADRAERDAMFGKVMERDPSKMTGFSKQLLDYFGATLDSGLRIDDDMIEKEAINEGQTKKQYTKFSMNTASDFMTMLGKYLDTDEGIQYITEFYHGINGADVFQQDKNASPMGFILQAIMNSEVSRLPYTLNAALTQRNASEREKNVAQTDINQGAAALLMKLAKQGIRNDTTDYFEELPEYTGGLVNQYLALLAHLNEVVGNV